MPIIEVFGVPDKFAKKDLEKFWEELRTSVEQVKEFQLTKDDVSVFFPKDLMQLGLGEEIIINVFGLFKKPERTQKVREHYAKLLGECANKFFPQAKIEVLINPFDLKQGFWTSTNSQIELFDKT